MSSDEYWFGDPYYIVAYREAQKLRAEEQNTNAWLHGLYIYDALCAASPLLRTNLSKKKIKPQDYLKKPLPLFKKEEKPVDKEDREEKERLFALAYMNNMVRAGKNWGKKT